MGVEIEEEERGRGPYHSCLLDTSERHRAGEVEGVAPALRLHPSAPEHALAVV